MTITPVRRLTHLALPHRVLGVRWRQGRRVRRRRARTRESLAECSAVAPGDPTYRYDPKYLFKGQSAKRPVEPNNPVGLVWIALSADSYGIHGTPDPGNVSKTASHGCVRLTNWDALALAKHVKTGTPVAFIE